MITWKISALALALALDAALASFAFGLMAEKDTLKTKMTKCLILSSSFGFFQFLLSWVGSWLGGWLTFKNVGPFLHFFIFMIFFILAIKCVKDSFSLEREVLDWKVLSIFAVAFGTSLDALFSGVSLYSVPFFELSVLWIGLVTFVMCLIFFGLSQMVRKIPEKWLLRLAAFIFSALGVRSLFHFQSF